MLLIKESGTIENKPSSVTIGTFDGVHLGHRQIIRRLQEQKFRTVVVTFEPHPQTVISPSRSPEIRILTTLDEKISIFESLGVDVLYVAKFDAALASKTGEEFVREILIGEIGLRHCVIGHDHAFGKNRSGNYQTLLELSQSAGFTVDRVEAFTQDNLVINSTAVRKLLLEGDVRRAGKLLDRPYVLNGTIIQGDGRGRTIGIPTANLQIDHPRKLIPANGVYATRAVIRNKTYDAVTNIGVRPTYNGQSLTVETHVLNFEQDIYGENMKLEFLYRIRDEKKLASPDELIRTIRADIDFAVKQGFTNI